MRLYIYIWRVYILPTPPHEQDATQGQIFKLSYTNLNSELYFLAWCYTMVNEPYLPYYSPLTAIARKVYNAIFLNSI